MTTSKLKIVFSVLMAELCSAYGATVRTATEGFVTNRVTQAAIAATNYTNAAIAALPAPDYSPTNAELRATIEATAPAPGNYAAVSNAAMTAAAKTEPIAVQDGGWFFDGTANQAYAARQAMRLSDESGLHVLEYNEESSRWRSNEYYGLYGYDFAYLSDLAAAAKAATNYVDSAIAALPESVTPATVTNIVDDALARFDPPIPTFDVYAEDVTNVVRECSLGGIWDAELEVWWTPVMVGGSLTYQATTNVNLNAEN